MQQDVSEFLDAVCRRDLKLKLSTSRLEELEQAISQAQATARLAYIVADRPDSIELYLPLANDIQAMDESPIFGAMENAGVLEVLDKYGSTIVPQMSVKDVPREDIELLTRCGIESPADEIVIALTVVRLQSAAPRHENTAGSGESYLWRMQEAQRLISDAGRELREISESRSSSYKPDLAGKPKKYFNGIGKVLSGVVAGTGNVLLAVGAIPATGGASIYAGVIASAAVSVGLVMQGVGDLRGE